ncbi:MAG: iron-containing alcohol dehydrogenase [Rhizobiaceae bacterium]
MTLITYLTRVHFADGVLEEALWSEMEKVGKKPALVLFDRKALSEDHIERFLSGFPSGTKIHEFCDIPPIPTESSVRRAADLYRSSECQIVVACGTATTIDFAKTVRVAVVHNEPLSTFSYARGGSARIGTGLPELIAAPDISGFGTAVSAHAPIILNHGERALLLCKKLIPTVSICDPTLTLDADKVATASAGADAITQCIEAYLSSSYNPPAEGIAMDGLKRAVGNIGTVLADGGNISARREMMAASLNGALALQKGLGACQAISNALGTVCEFPIRPGTLNRIALPKVLHFNQNAVNEKFEPLRSVFGVQKASELVDGVQALFASLPLPNRLSDLGVTSEHIEDAAQLAATDLATNTNPRPLARQDFLSIMRSVH